MQVSASGQMAVIEDLFSGGVEKTLKWLATYGLIANRQPCPPAPANCANPGPQRDMSLRKDASRIDGFLVMRP